MGQYAQILEGCQFCLRSPALPRERMIALGERTHLSLPAAQMVPFHSVITVTEHETAMVAVGEEAWAEVELFMRGLVAMFKRGKMDVVFMETVHAVRKQRHTCVHAFPLLPESGELAPMYFRKAIDEGDEQWSQHKKVIETRGRGLRRSVPKGFPYFYVQFGMDDGFAHVIEDEAKFPADFGVAIIAGMLELEPSAWRHPKPDAADVVARNVKKFLDLWAPFDWTKQLP
eukprot:c3676_g1_i1.p2 GENE.c3676_g1_i1~~c3676_g1_i1.p2  ORF type:complete len:229 (-),score=42.29 c3676_g1_i1:38-724(-)